MSEYLTTQEVADRLGVSVFTIRRYIRAGMIRAVRLEGGYRLSRDDLAEFLKSREIGGFPVSSEASEPSPPARHATSEKDERKPSSAPEESD